MALRRSVWEAPAARSDCQGRPDGSGARFAMGAGAAMSILGSLSQPRVRSTWRGEPWPGSAATTATSFIDPRPGRSHDRTGRRGRTADVDRRPDGRLVWSHADRAIATSFAGDTRARASGCAPGPELRRRIEAGRPRGGGVGRRGSRTRTIGCSVCCRASARRRGSPGTFGSAIKARNSAWPSRWPPTRTLSASGWRASCSISSRAWQEAEETAQVADGLGLPSTLDDQVEQLKRARPGDGEA